MWVRGSFIIMRYAAQKENEFLHIADSKGAALLCVIMCF